MPPSLAPRWSPPVCRRLVRPRHRRRRLSSSCSARARRCPLLTRSDRSRRNPRPTTTQAWSGRWRFPTSRYSRQLANAGIEGTVVARFLVDTAGRVEPGTIQLSAGSHPLLGESVREALERSRFSPAESGGRRVRQLVQQSFSFAFAFAFAIAIAIASRRE
ncbi:MAG: TonB family protein [Gemmatimonadaceae bacterium]|nr:TonB family protein [Gemmatimonadaceae bacterium]